MSYAKQQAIICVKAWVKKAPGEFAWLKTLKKFTHGGHKFVHFIEYTTSCWPKENNTDIARNGQYYFDEIKDTVESSGRKRFANPVQ